MSKVGLMLGNERRTKHRFRSHFELLCGFSQIGFVDDVIAIKNSSRLMAADRHRHSLGNAATNHVANGRAAKIVEKEPAEVEFLVLPLLRAVAAPYLALGILDDFARARWTKHVSDSSRAADLRPEFAEIAD